MPIFSNTQHAYKWMSEQPIKFSGLKSVVGGWQPIPAVEPLRWTRAGIPAAYIVVAFTITLVVIGFLKIKGV